MTYGAPAYGSAAYAGKVTTVKNFILSLIDTLSVSVALKKDSTRVIIDGVAMTDNADKAKIISQLLSDTVSATDAIVRNTTKVITNAITVIASVTKANTRRFIESIAILDSFAYAMVLFRELTETLTATDNLKGITLKSLQEAISIASDSLRTLSKKLSEALSTTETIDKSVSKIKELTEAVTITYNVIKTAFVEFSEEIVATALFSAKQTKELIESIVVTSSQAILKVIAKAHCETIRTKDYIAKELNGVVYDIWNKVSSISTIWTKYTKDTDEWQS